ncbi:TetM/TetW/TetO/TetS family tetracycline resistance ribosomal protection protein [Sedimentibacter sp. zth1]|uniref:GTP-binding protein n=1 Tax=Sedimentibacter sp. zth1 TaxID=2816908 RepID=UPI001A918023|nr:TetM/TetW/TetO/TetS family tetracycline resistance ribosomal protection protein [Sedimentibacter sp. zth1]QSX06085.1 TetM/TetW/TetO/TetS family tetracycline resistance ribosomal protection protein [Sedimentibacter sp. zth1]
MNKTIGVAAHVDAGKTTLIEQILYNTNTIKEAGRVDKKSSFLDYHDIEKKRGITVFSEEAHVKYKNSTLHIIDTPGHIDFSSELERSIQVLDCCIIVISAASGVTSHTKTIWRLLQKHNIPTLFFINKLDIIGTDYVKVFEDIKNNLTDNLIPITKPKYKDINFDTISCVLCQNDNKDELLEQLANVDDNILDKFLNEIPIKADELNDSIKKLVNNCSSFPVFCGVGLRNIGVNEILDFIDEYISTKYEANKKFSGFVYKIRYDENYQKLTYIKVISGKIKVKDTLEHKSINETPIDKINQIRIYNGNNFKQVNELYAGEYGAIPGLNSSYVGECFGDCMVSENSLTPTLKSKVVFDEKYNYNEIYKIFRILTDEDPLLNVAWIKELNEIHVNIMGTIQLEILKDVIAERFKVEVNFEKPEVIYMETILDETSAIGHFEPYKHFAEVTLKITPSKINSGISFSSSCHVDILPLRWQKMVERVIPYACKKGVLTGSELTDIEIELTDGKHSIKHTSSGDFKEATFRAVRKAIEQTESILLEPYYSFSITVQNELSGKIMTDITTMCGSFEAPTCNKDKTTIVGNVPVSEFIDYPSKLLSLTKGNAILNSSFSGYGICHNSKEIIEKIGYDSKADKEFTSHSIYCANGKSFSVE